MSGVEMLGGAQALPARRKLAGKRQWLAIGACALIPIPLIALTGIGLPLPDSIERGIAALLPGGSSAEQSPAPASTGAAPDRHHPSVGAPRSSDHSAPARRLHSTDRASRPGTVPRVRTPDKPGSGGGTQGGTSPRDPGAGAVDTANGNTGSGTQHTPTGTRPPAAPAGLSVTTDGSSVTVRVDGGSTGVRAGGTVGTSEGGATATAGTTVPGVGSTGVSTTGSTQGVTASGGAATPSGAGTDASAGVSPGGTDASAGVTVPGVGTVGASTSAPTDGSAPTVGTTLLP